MVVDCRSLIEFCKAFEQYRSMTNTVASADGGKQSINGPSLSRSVHKRALNGVSMHTSSSLPSSAASPFCEKSSAAAVDVIILMLVLGACGFLFTPYFKYLCSEAAEILPPALVFIGELVYQAPLAYICGIILTFAMIIVVWELIQHKARKCDNPKCRGLRKAVEFDIQLESEKCLKSMGTSTSSSSLSPIPTTFSHEVPWKGCVELGNDQKELEAELRRMAPPNGRAVLVFRLPCGCPTARMEVWGAKKPRKSKK
ncbi:hypothetical protein KP509_02G066400 [Ceratopteris richardii]|uniref:Ribosomal protein L34e superfamily protein n=1 Tax=Ceratopteris richardii TaxID=49495 RepID=A0A8T2VDR2_CERRI|nr:hypothetical protein KP509_02G066400 [Ceratopteris richardii]